MDSVVNNETNDKRNDSINYVDREILIQNIKEQCTEDEFRNVLCITSVLGPLNNIIREEYNITDDITVGQLKNIIIECTKKYYSTDNSD